MDVIGWLMMRPPILQLNISNILYYIVGPILFKDKCFIAFLGDAWAKHLEVYISILSFTQHQPLWAFIPFLGQYTLKSQEIRKWRRKMMKSGKYGWERYDGSLRELSVANPSPRKTTY
jgi:hypothetical protein